MRSINSYQRVRKLIGFARRNRAWQARSEHLRSMEYLNSGCGPHVTPGFVNLDYRWVPGVDLVWDSTRKLPFPPNRFRGIFTEHCLEHFDLEQLHRVLQDFHRVLKPGGRLRVVVPSLEKHLAFYRQAATKDLTDLPESYTDAETPAHGLNGIFYCGFASMKDSKWIHDGHHFIHDFSSLEHALRKAGFSNVLEKSYGVGGDNDLLIDQEERAWESLYVEATKSGAQRE